MEAKNWPRAYWMQEGSPNIHKLSKNTPKLVGNGLGIQAKTWKFVFERKI